MHANKIVSAQRSTVFFLDLPKEQLWSVSTDTGEEIRIPMTAGIAGLCCMEGKLINIPDAYADSRFNQAVDKRTGFKTHSILAVPILEEGHYESSAGEVKRKSRCSIKAKIEEAPPVVGIIQMINKQSFDGQLEAFDDADIEMMEMFAKFVGPKLAQGSMLVRRTECVELSEGERSLGKMTEVLSPQ